MPSRVSKHQVQAVEARVALLERVDHAQALQVVLEAAVRSLRMQSFSASWPAWPNGVWPRSCASAIASTRSSFRPQRARDRAAELRHFERVRQARAEQVALVVEEDLRLVDQAPERRAVDDAVAVALELVARGRRRLGDGAGRASCAGSQAYGREHARRRRRASAACRRASTSRTSASGAARTRGAARRLDHDEADLAALGLLVDAHQLEVALGAERRRRAPAGRRARPARVRRSHDTPRRSGRARRDRSAAITMPQPTASPCSQSP